MMGIQARQSTKSIDTKAVISTWPAVRPARQADPVDTVPENADAMETLGVLAETYEVVADRLLDQIHDCANNPRIARALSPHLDRMAVRAQIISGFITAGDRALSYICASGDAYDRLLSLVTLAAQNARKPDGLPVTLFLMEKIDEELRLA